MPLERIGEVITLRARDARLEIAPRDGGALVSWSLSGLDLLRRRAAGCTDPLASGCFPLAPFSNLIMGGGFCFQGSFHRLARTLWSPIPFTAIPGLPPGMSTSSAAIGHSFRIGMAPIGGFRSATG